VLREYGVDALLSDFARESEEILSLDRTQKNE